MLLFSILQNSNQKSGLYLNQLIKNKKAPKMPYKYLIIRLLIFVNTLQTTPVYKYKNIFTKVFGLHFQTIYICT